MWMEKAPHYCWQYGSQMMYFSLDCTGCLNSRCTAVVVVAIVNTQKSRLILVNMEIGCKDPFVNRWIGKLCVQLFDYVTRTLSVDPQSSWKFAPSSPIDNQDDWSIYPRKPRIKSWIILKKFIEQ